MNKAELHKKKVSVAEQYRKRRMVITFASRNDSLNRAMQVLHKGHRLNDYGVRWRLVRRVGGFWSMDEEYEDNE
jgi:hypothetical protein